MFSFKKQNKRDYFWDINLVTFTYLVGVNITFDLPRGKDNPQRVTGILPISQSPPTLILELSGS